MKERWYLKKECSLIRIIVKEYLIFGKKNYPKTSILIKEGGKQAADFYFSRLLCLPRKENEQFLVNLGCTIYFLPDAIWAFCRNCNKNEIRSV
jgi:hypothetical protein